MPENSTSHESQRNELSKLQAQLAARLIPAIGASQNEGHDRIAALSREELDRTTDTLVRKRLSQTQKMLPKSAVALGIDLFRSDFLEFARRNHFNGLQAITWDAIRFAEHELKRLDTIEAPPYLRSCLVWERLLCLISARRCLVIFDRLDWDIANWDWASDMPPNKRRQWICAFRLGRLEGLRVFNVPVLGSRRPRKH